MIVTVLIGLAIGLVVAEISLRFIMPDLPSEDWGLECFCRNKALNYRFMKPNYEFVGSTSDGGGFRIHSNSYGFRDGEWSEKLKSGKKRVMMLGDSYGWGWGCTQDSMLSSILKDTRKDMTVFNLCIPGDNLFRHYQRFRYFKDEIKPDHILVIQCVNDFQDIPGQRKLLAKSEADGIFNRRSQGPVDCDLFYGPSLKSTLNKSYVFRRAINTYHAFKWTSRKSDRQFEDSLLRKGMQSDYANLSDPAWLGQVSEFYRFYLTELSKVAKVTVFYIPFSYEVDTAKLKSIQQVMGADEKFEPARLNAGLRKIVSTVPGVSYIDPTEVFRREERQSTLYIPLDGHLNQRGHAWMARIISDSLHLD